MAASIPTPGEWLARLVASADMSHAALARKIGRSRAEVTRWTSGREQIPRMHLAEIADQFGPSGALDYVMRLKDCEDAEDLLVRWSSRLAKRLGTNRPDIGDTLLASVHALATPNLAKPAAAQERFRLLTTARFAVTQWSLFAENNNTDLFAPESIGRHLRYPVNHFMGILLLDSPGTSAPSLQITRVLGLANLRELVKSSPVAEMVPLIRHHAIHMLARYGDEADRGTVQEMTLQGLNSHDRLSRKLAFSGLIMSQQADSDNADKFLFELARDSELAAVDLAFDATHYGDLALNAEGQLRPLDSFAPMLIQNIAKHYARPQVYERLADIDAFRALSVLEFSQPSEIPQEVETALVKCVESGAINPSVGAFQRMLYQSLSRLPSISPSSRPAPRTTVSDIYNDRDGATGDEYDLFISYASADVVFVRKLDQCLANNGLRCWVDFRRMALGRPVQESMQKGLESSRAFLVVLGATVGKWEMMELQRAIEHFVDNDKRVIPFIKSGRTMPQSTPVFLRSFHGIFLDSYTNLEAACSKIAASLRSD